MHIATQWQQTDTIDPYNPNQITRQPNNTWSSGAGYEGGYSTAAWNKQPVTATLGGLGGSVLGSLPTWAQALVVAGVAAGVGYFGLKRIGPRFGLAGRRGRRR